MSGPIYHYGPVYDPTTGKPTYRPVDGKPVRCPDCYPININEYLDWVVGVSYTLSGCGDGNYAACAQTRNYILEDAVFAGGQYHWSHYENLGGGWWDVVILRLYGGLDFCTWDLSIQRFLSPNYYNCWRGQSVLLRNGDKMPRIDLDYTCTSPAFIVVTFT